MTHASELGHAVHVDAKDADPKKPKDTEEKKTKPPPDVARDDLLRYLSVKVQQLSSTTHGGGEDTVLTEYVEALPDPPESKTLVAHK